MRNLKHAETIGVFKDETQLIHAIDELYQIGFERQDISIQGDSKYIRQRFGEQYIIVDPAVKTVNH